MARRTSSLFIFSFLAFSLYRFRARDHFRVKGRMWLLPRMRKSSPTACQATIFAVGFAGSVCGSLEKLAPRVVRRPTLLVPKSANPVP